MLTYIKTSRSEHPRCVRASGKKPDITRSSWSPAPRGVRVPIPGAVRAIERASHSCMRRRSLFPAALLARVGRPVLSKQSVDAEEQGAAPAAA